jgi:hypothetical protein
VGVLGVLQASSDLSSLGRGLRSRGPAGPGPGSGTMPSKAGGVAGSSAHTVAPARGSSGCWSGGRSGGSVVAGADSFSSSRPVSSLAG